MVVFVAVRQSVDMGVMDQRVVAISPGKLLGPEIKKNIHRTSKCLNYLMRRWS